MELLCTGILSSCRHQGQEAKKIAATSRKSAMIDAGHLAKDI